VVPELWVGDFDSAGSELTMQYRDVPRDTFPAEKDVTDGAIAVAEAILRGASEIVLLGGLGGQTDHTAGLLGQSLQIAREGVACLLSSGTEEAWPLIPGRMTVELPPGTRFSIIPFVDLVGLDLTGVKWPLAGRSVPVGSTLTLSVQLSEPAQQLGGRFTTTSANGQVNFHELARGDAVLFCSECVHNVTTLTQGCRNSLVIELWTEPPNHIDRHK
jgi:thiamine pyrophosphokinase